MCLKFGFYLKYLSINEFLSAIRVAIRFLASNLDLNQPIYL